MYGIFKVVILSLVSFLLAFAIPFFVSQVALSTSGFIRFAVLSILLVWAVFIIYVSPEVYRYFYAATLGAFFCLNTIHDTFTVSGVAVLWPFVFSLFFLFAVFFSNFIATNGSSGKSAKT